MLGVMKRERQSPLRSFREHLGMTQVEFAGWASERLGWSISQTEISKWETGKRRMSRANAAAIELATGGRVSVRSYRSWIGKVRSVSTEVSP